jgi:hypothetical protein
MLVPFRKMQCLALGNLIALGMVRHVRTRSWQKFAPRRNMLTLILTGKRDAGA